jgi:hypothetical protein
MVMADASVYTTNGRDRSGKARHGAEVIAVLMAAKESVHVLSQCVTC